MIKNLEILLVEDEPKHLADAKAEVQKVIERVKEFGVAIQVDYASSYVEAQKAMKGKKYDGIISDIFFPFDMEAPEEELPWGEKAIKGWSGAAKTKGYELLTSGEKPSRMLKELDDTGVLDNMEVLGYKKVEKTLTEWGVDRETKTKLEALKWLGGQAMHPTGVMVVEEAVKQKIPVVVCTDQWHHGYSLTPVYGYFCHQPGVELVDSPHDSFEPVPTKSWDEAIKRLYKRISH